MTPAAGRSLLGPAHPANHRPFDEPPPPALPEASGTRGGRAVGGFHARAASPEFDGGPAVGDLYGRPQSETDRGDDRPAAESPEPRSLHSRRAAGAPDGGASGRPETPDPLQERARPGAGRGPRKLLVPYLTAGVTENWLEYLFAMQDAGADAIEIGLPFSDPMLDGATVQQSSDRALARGVTVAGILRELHTVRHRVRVPLIAFTYSNLVFRPGPAVFCRQLAEAGLRGLIVPDLPLDEAGEVEAAAAAAGIELTLLVAPVTTDDRLAEIAARSRGYIYAISHMGTTGERDSLASSAATVVARIKRVARVPVLVGFGISGVEQVAAAGRVGDGVVVGSALMRRVLDGATPQQLGAEVAALRGALDALDEEASADRTAYAEVSGDRR
jgi:tryptophan synthase alpha chain